MKNSILLLLLFINVCYGQEKPIFVDKDNSTLLSLDCATTLNGLKVNFTIPSKAFEYDEVYFYLKITAGTKEEENYQFVSSYLKDAFRVKFEGVQSHSVWIANPENKGLGEFTYQKKHFVSDQYLCGNSKNVEITVEASIIGYMETGSEQLYDDYNGSWYTQKYYDNGTYLTTSDALIIKQTDDNIKAYKRKLLKSGMGF